MSGGSAADIPAARTAHLCVDMQRMFAEDTPWHMPWMMRVAPVIRKIAERHARRTIFTRFIPPARPEDMPGQWQKYYRHWRDMTRERLPPQMLDLIAPLAELVPPARLHDKAVYSPFATPQLHRELQAAKIGILVITGGETDMCVLATVLGAIDHGYRVILPTDALCSSSDGTHDAMLKLYRERFGQQIELCDSDDLLARWKTAAL